MTIRTPLALGLALLSSLTLTACDDPICPSSVSVLIVSPSADASLSSAQDQDPNAAGVQTTVNVASNFKAGTTLNLTVTDERTGAVSQHTADAGADGAALFAGVTLPAGPVKLAVNGTSKCGTASTEIAVNVITDGVCDMSIAEGPIDNAFYAPVPVLNSSNDSDTALPNFQANLNVSSAAGFVVEFYVLDVLSGSEASAGTVTADANGLATLPVTLAQGHQAVRATCQLAGANAASATSTVFVDTVTPSCTLTSPRKESPLRLTRTKMMAPMASR